MDNIKNYEKLGAICGQIVYLYKNPVLFDSLSVKAVMGQINEIMDVLGDDWKVEDALLKNCLYALMGIISHKPSENGTIEDTFYHSANEKEFWDNIHTVIKKIRYFHTKEIKEGLEKCVNSSAKTEKSSTL